MLFFYGKRNTLLCETYAFLYEACVLWRKLAFFLYGKPLLLLGNLRFCYIEFMFFFFLEDIDFPFRQTRVFQWKFDAVRI